MLSLPYLPVVVACFGGYLLADALETSGVTRKNLYVALTVTV